VGKTDPYHTTTTNGVSSCYFSDGTIEAHFFKKIVGIYILTYAHRFFLVRNFSQVYMLSYAIMDVFFVVRFWAFSDLWIHLALISGINHILNIWVMGENREGKEVPPESRLHTDAGEALVSGNRPNKIAPVQTASPDFERITYGNLQWNQSLGVWDSARSQGGRNSDDNARPRVSQRDENPDKIKSDKSVVSTSVREKDVHESKDYSNNPESELTQKRVLRKVTLSQLEESLSKPKLPPKNPKETIPIPKVLFQPESQPDARIELPSLESLKPNMNLPDLLDEFENLENTPTNTHPNVPPTSSLNPITNSVVSPIETNKPPSWGSLHNLVDKKKLISQVLSSRANKLKFENDSKRSSPTNHARTVNSNFVPSRKPESNPNSDSQMDDSDIYDALFDLINQGIVIIDINMSILFSN
jgi:hypothetical protein